MLLLFDKLGDVLKKADVLESLGSILENQGNLSESLHCLQKALEIYELLGKLEQEASTHIEISKIYLSRGDELAALKNYHKALAIYKQLGEQSAIRNTHFGLVEIYLEQGRYAKAVHLLEMVLQLTDDPLDRAGLLNSIARFRIQQAVQLRGKKKFKGAVKAFKRAEKELQEAASLTGVLGNKEMLIFNLTGLTKYKLIELNGKIAEIEAKINYLAKDNWEVLQMILTHQRASIREFVVLLCRMEKE